MINLRAQLALDLGMFVLLNLDLFLGRSQALLKARLGTHQVLHQGFIDWLSA